MAQNFTLKSLSSKLIGSTVFGVVVYLVLSALALGGEKDLVQFDWKWLPIILLLSAANYILRFVKWQYYLRLLELKIPLWDSLVIFLSGFALSITPGKLGEMVRSYFLKEGFGAPVAKTAPIFLADRLADVMALVILSAIGAVSYHYGQSVIWVLVIIIGLVFLAVTVRPVAYWVLSLVERIPGVKTRHMVRLRRLYEASAILLDIRRIWIPLVLSVVAWGLEAIGLYVTFLGLGLDQDLLAAIFIYSFSTIVGALSMLPGGLGATEGSITGLMKLLSVSTATAALAAIIIRAATLWFAVALGVIFLIIAGRRYRSGS